MTTSNFRAKLGASSNLEFAVIDLLLAVVAQTSLTSSNNYVDDLDVYLRTQVGKDSKACDYVRQKLAEVREQIAQGK